MNEIPLAREESINSIGQISRDLRHPQAVGGMGNASDFHSTGRNVDKEQDDKAFESGTSPDLNGEKVGSDDLSPMATKKFSPRRFTTSRRCWFDAMSLQNVGNRCAPD